MSATGRYINPWRLWTGAFIPEWLMPRAELSPGAKLAYARLCRYAGKHGIAWPFLRDLGEALGVGERQARRYTSELAKHELVDIQRRGHGEPDVYRFPEHPWMGLDGEDISVPSRADTSDLSRGDMDDRSRTDRSDPSVGTHLTGAVGTDPTSPFLTESVEESQEESHRGDGLTAAAKARVPINEHECWRALIDALGAKPETKAERGRFAVAVRQLIDIDATAAEIRSRVRAYRQKWPAMAVTPTAIVAHWSELAAPSPPAPLALGRRDCDLCDGTGFVSASPGAVIHCPKCNAAKEQHA